LSAYLSYDGVHSISYRSYSDKRAKGLTSDTELRGIKVYTS